MANTGTSAPETEAPAPIETDASSLAQQGHVGELRRTFLRNAAVAALAAGAKDPVEAWDHAEELYREGVKRGYEP